MGTSRNDIIEMIEYARKEGASHMLVVCDTFDWEDYPVPVFGADKVPEQVEKYSRDMQKIMEVYDLGKDIETQLDQPRAGAGVFF